MWDFDQDEDEVAVANYGSQIQEYIPQSKVCGLRKCFFDTSQRVFEKGFLQSGGCGLRNDFQIHLRALFVLFCYFFNYALFCFIFIQSFCFNQNCLKVYFYITIYFSEDFYCSFACFVVQSTLSRSLLHYRVVKCHLLDFIVCFSRFLFYKSYYYILYLP